MSSSGSISVCSPTFIIITPTSFATVILLPFPYSNPCNPTTNVFQLVSTSKPLLKSPLACIPLSCPSGSTCQSDSAFVNIPYKSLSAYYSPVGHLHILFHLDCCMRNQLPLKCYCSSFWPLSLVGESELPTAAPVLLSCMTRSSNFWLNYFRPSSKILMHDIWHSEDILNASMTLLCDIMTSTWSDQ